MKTCPHCHIEMKSLQNSERKIYDFELDVIPFIRSEGNTTPIISNLFVCSKCGLVEQYVIEECIKYLQS